MEQLFQCGKDEIQYKEKNQVANIAYNENGKCSHERKGMLVQRDETPFLMFPSLEKISDMRHGFSTRLGGVSKEHLSTMNLSYNRNDDPANVLENYRRISHAIGFDMDNMVFSDQVHDTRIHVVTQEDRSAVVGNAKHLEGIDGLITNEEGIVLVTFYADCVPLYFVDPVHRAIGLSHSGWRGTVNRIGQKTVESMSREYGTNPADLIVVIGPSICRDCYEVSKDVAEAFAMTFKEEQAKKILEEKTDGKFQLDLWLANRYILEEAGVRPENLSVSEICTCCNSSLLYSHRASQGMRGNLAAFLSLEKTH